jgi:hypothetical protein
MKNQMNGAATKSRTGITASTATAAITVVTANA